MKSVKFTQENLIGDTMLTLFDGRKICASNIHVRHERNRVPTQITQEEALSVTQTHEPLSKQTRCIVLIAPTNKASNPDAPNKNSSEVHLAQLQSSHLTITGSAMGKLAVGDIIILSDALAKLEDDQQALFRTAKVVSSVTSIEDNTFISNFKAYSSCKSR